ncbi:MAG: hypothetical protein LC667_11870 [Thioalkalivibrio sp.]|nr:hypothetical protein [Thioalkalivibrio sp.]
MIGWVQSKPPSRIDYFSRLMAIAVGVVLVGAAVVMVLMAYAIHEDNLLELDRLLAGDIVVQSRQARDLAESVVMASLVVVGVEVGLGLWLLAVALLEGIWRLPKIVHCVWDAFARGVLGASVESVERIRRARRSSQQAEQRSLRTLALAVGIAGLAAVSCESQGSVRTFSVLAAVIIAISVVVAHGPVLVSVWHEQRPRGDSRWWQSEFVRVLWHTALGSALTVSLWFGLVATIPSAFALLVDVTIDVATWRVSGLEERIGPKLVRLADEGYVGEEHAGTTISGRLRELIQIGLVADARGASSPAVPWIRCWLVLFAPSWVALGAVSAAVRYRSDVQKVERD